MNIKKISTFIAISLFVLSSSIAQDRLVRGKVTTFDSIPLINASVLIKSTKQTIKTDSIGNFSAYCNTPEKLKISANGFLTRNVKIPENVKVLLINLKLKSTEEAKEIATGYGHVKDKDKLYSMVSLNSKEMDFSMYKDVFEIIRGRFPGVRVESDQIIIRGINSITGSSAALIVVDGITADASLANSIPPHSIKSINILKDGSAARYGVRGANGVVVIETKRGNE